MRQIDEIAAYYVEKTEITGKEFDEAYQTLSESEFNLSGFNSPRSWRVPCKRIPEIPRSLAAGRFIMYYESVLVSKRRKEYNYFRKDYPSREEIQFIIAHKNERHFSVIAGCLMVSMIVLLIAFVTT